MSVLGTVFIILSMIVGLVFLIDCFRFSKEINAYVKYGIGCGFILVGIDVGILLLIPDAFSIMPVYQLIAVDFMALVRMTVFTCMGMYCCSLLGLRAFPGLQSSPEPGQTEEPFDWAPFILAGTTVILSVLYSAVLFKLTSPGMSEALKKLSGVPAARLGADTKPSLLMTLVVLEFAFGEEIVFRLGIQNYLARQFKLAGGRYWIAIVVTAMFWSLAHANTLDPEWVKIAQVFPLGLALGFLFRKYGTGMCILVHGAFNVVMMFLAPYLMGR